MKSTLALVITIALIAACGVLVADDASAAEESSSPEFPSFKEIIDTVEFHEYSLDRFLNDTQTIFSAESFKQMGDYGGDLIDFIVNDTFVGNIGSGNLSESFSSGNYINYFVLACFIIAIVCVLGAFISYFLNRKTFMMEREE